MEKVSLESFKNKFNEETKTELLDELTGGILGCCHCNSGLPTVGPFACEHLEPK